MILDRGILKLCRAPEDTGRSGDMMSEELTEYHVCWYGERTVGMSRYYAAQQANSRIDRAVRIRALGVDVRADDVAILGKERYRVLQAQYLRDEDAGCEVIDLSLERTGYRDGNN